jgi:hypothetical protein
MTTDWEAPGLLSSTEFFLKCELIGCITTWCIIIVPLLVHGDVTTPWQMQKVRKKGVVWYTTFGQAPSQKEPH